MMTKAELHKVLVEALQGIYQSMPAEGYQLTLICRHPSNSKAHILETTEENIGLAIDAVKQLMDQPDSTLFP